MTAAAPIIKWNQFIIPAERGGGTLSGAVVQGKTPGSLSALLRVGNRQDTTLILASRGVGAPLEAQLLSCSPDTGCERLSTLKPVKNRYRLPGGIEVDANRTSEDRLDVTVRGMTSDGSPHVLNYYNRSSPHVAMASDGSGSMLPSLMRGGTKIRVGRSQGYGIFATEDIKAGEIVEEAPVLTQDAPFLTNYTFSTGTKNLLPLGNISLYNHSEQPTCSHALDAGSNIMTLTATRDIPAGSELSISYGGSLWFTSRGMKSQKI